MSRKITKEQFSNGLNVDGNRLDNALQDVQDSVNAVPLSSVKTRYVPYQIVGGTTPSRAHFIRRLYDHGFGPILVSPDDPFRSGQPVTGIDGWLPATHAFTNLSYTEVINTPVFPTSLMENPVSVKGSCLNTSYYSTAGRTRDYVMTNSFSTREPIIIDEISCFMAANNHYPITHQVIAGAGLPPPFWGQTTDGSSLADIQFFITVDDADLSESVQLRTTEFCKQSFPSFAGHMIQQNVLSVSTGFNVSPGGIPSMFLPGIGNSIEDTNVGLYFVFKNLKISIPEYGRWRLHILIPDYQYSQYNKTDWGTQPWLFETSWSICALEEIVTL